VRDLASGSPLGHPLHPVLVAIPIGAWTSASILDLTGGDATAAKRLIGLGSLAALPTALTGANDWLTTLGGERRVGLVHAALNDTALGLYVSSWLARRRGRRIKGAALALAGAGVLGVAGWLGGHLAYGLGVGVDTTVFQHFPQDWTDVAAEADVPVSQPMLADAAGIPVMLIRQGGTILALGDRCTHRGGPLHEGTVADGCVTCPWHGSQFTLADGSVQHGPATRPEPVAEARVLDGRVQVRRADEPRALRTKPIGL
jgi:nitrite reductase/ring-hydroxylating ferredoxin subunit/uncharacterized membrane protein